VLPVIESVGIGYFFREWSTLNPMRQAQQRQVVCEVAGLEVITPIPALRSGW